MPAVVIKIWINGFCKSCKNISKDNDLNKVDEIILVWKKFNKGFGLYFLVNSIVAQILSIVTAFLTISHILDILVDGTGHLNTRTTLLFGAIGEDFKFFLILNLKQGNVDVLLSKM